MISNFSFKYNEKLLTCSDIISKNTSEGTVFNIEEGIEVCLKEKKYPDYNASEWVLWFENKSQKNSGIFSDIFDCDTFLPIDMPDAPNPGYMPKPGDACVITMNGMVDGHYYWENDKVSATEYAFNYEYLDKAPDKKKCFENFGGRSSEGMMPFFDITANNEGYIAAIGWTGDWRAEFKKDDSGIYIRTGLKETNFYLKPGERIRTSSIVIMKYTSDEDKHNKYRRFIKNHFSHMTCTNTTKESLFAFEFWGGLRSEEMKKRIRELKEYNIPFEDIWIDAGWYGKCTKCDDAFTGDWGDHTGDWSVNRLVHPDGMKDVSECAKEIGAKLMLWFEPERAIDTTNLVREHYDWFLHPKRGGNHILWYGNEDAKNYVVDLLSSYAKELDLSCYRQDFNTILTGYFKENDEENRRGIMEIKHIAGMYEVWDRLLERCPWLVIDNCASGGRRIDIETLKRSIPFFRTDYLCSYNENSTVLQTHNANISSYLPYNGCSSKNKGDTYSIRSSYSSSWGVMMYAISSRNMESEDFLRVKKLADEYLRIRDYFNMDFYNHGSCDLDDTSWAIWQYHNPETQKGIVMAFRRENSPFETVKVNLKGILEGKVYTVENVDENSVTKITDTLEIVLKDKRSSVVFEYGVEE